MASMGRQEEAAMRAQAESEARGGLARHVTTFFWPLTLAGLAYAAAASRSQTAFTPFVLAGAAAYATRKAMDSDRDYISFGTQGIGNALGFDFLAREDWLPF